ncbi:protein SHORT HYPOCOTYL IN WHITE LIGHT 1 [Papaver somniferum]|uniref:protein SHORT HYPOCOTYL IN WHITE LIGHT 1 n=1 Tax=Papaver somniferum TaxID=3469 RepID=UPI000E6F4711|nr:protein SHORT HYPOCOTYL IN WHITE LIGHT 1 [Papaver somniferum]
MAGTISINSSLLPYSPPKHLLSNIFFPLSITPQISSLKFLRNPTTRQRIRNPRINANNGGKSRRTSAAEELEETFFGYEIEDEETDDDDEEDDDDDEIERESSMDLLFRFVQSMYKKISKRAKKATRSILPPAISPPLVSFAVDGVLLLTLLSIVKALLQVVCTLGGTVFIVILMVRVIWATMSYFQSNVNGSSQSNGNSFNSTIPA